MENKKIKLIIFDYDDTIIERNSELIFSDLKEAEQIIEYINKKYPRIVKLKETLRDVFNHFNINFDEDKIEEYAKKYVRFYETGKIKDNVKTLLRELSENYTLIILSNGGKKSKINELKYNNFEDVFKDIITPEDSGYEKPDSRAFEYVLKKYNLNVDEVISIGNSYTFDIAPAKSIGIKTILITKKNADLNLGSIEDVNKETISKL
ncbi:MAG: HAD family hydrolase [Nanoarchaeota archaeon]